MLRSILERDKEYTTLTNDAGRMRLLGNVLGNYEKPYTVKQQTRHDERGLLKIATMDTGDYYAKSRLFSHKHTVDHEFVKEILAANAIHDMGHMGDDLGHAAEEYHAAEAHPEEPPSSARVGGVASRAAAEVKPEPKREQPRMPSEARMADASVVRAEVISKEADDDIRVPQQPQQPPQQPQQPPQPKIQRVAATMEQSVEHFKTEFKDLFLGIDSLQKPKLEELAMAYNTAKRLKQREENYIPKGVKIESLRQRLKEAAKELFPHMYPTTPVRAARAGAGGSDDSGGPKAESPD